ncbi:phage tail protein [Mesorhizobium sp. M4B.F.Ca.ET.089.01.1.1]|uniref:phage tail protein n=1 Tax=Mesorhizobium sp. M4B.F.Ca.ET.089.01.1.1 TaxID=2496662 RepID=UPI001677B399|nr:phage tail protein [Mesorhizobium sp. M4B.F.Ca.ET.089.01.1.1]
MGKSGGKIEIHEYTMSLHVGICAAGEGLSLIAVKYGDKEIWRGNATDQGVFAVNKTDLFGGSKKEGGVKGLLWWLPGKDDQSMPESLAKRYGLTSDTCPGFRGLSSFFLTGTKDASEPSGTPWWSTGILSALLGGGAANNKAGFYLGANNPYLRSMSARVRRPSIGLNPAIALIRIPDDSKGNAQYASNPAHMTYECLTNTDWALGEPVSAINKASFEAAAQTLYDEGFGLNMTWLRQTEIGKFIGEISTHIQSAVYVDPSTGKHTMKLLRADYDFDDLPEINPSNAKLSSFKRKTWGEISNEVVVTYTNAETGKEATVTAQDLAGIAAQGGIVSTSQNYYGVPHEALAIRLADRDLAMMVNPIATLQATVTREFWKTAASNVVKLSWPERNIDQIIFRVSEVNKTDHTVELSLYEDIFGLDQASYLAPGDSQWQNPTLPPTPATYYQMGTAPAFMTAAALRLSDPSELVYPEVLSAVTVGADSNDDVNYDLVSNVTDVNGTPSQAVLSTSPYRGTWAFLTALVAEPQTVLSTLTGLRGSEPVAGDFVLIGTGPDEYTEIATVQSVDEDGFHLNRGMLDTIPRAWPIGTRAFVIPASTLVVDPTVRSAFEDTSYWILPRTTGGVLALADAPQINVSLTERPYLANRPANVKVNGVGFGDVDANEATELTVTWANRNRILESTQVMKWDDANVAGEAGQTSKVVVTTLDGSTVLQTYGGLTGTSKVIPLTDLPGQKRVLISVAAEKDGNKSLQAYELMVKLITRFFTSATLVGTGSMAATGSKRTRPARSALFMGMGGVAAGYTVRRVSAATFTGSGMMAATYTKKIRRSASFEGAGSLSAIPARGFTSGFDAGFR